MTTCHMNTRTDASHALRERSVFLCASTQCSFTQHSAEAAVFIGKKFIQRFTSSNPYGLDVQTVEEAFLNGVFNGTVYCI